MCAYLQLASSTCLHSVNPSQSAVSTPALLEDPRKVDAATSDDGCEKEHSRRKAPEHLTIRLTSRAVGPQLVRTPDALSSSAVRRAAGASAIPRHGARFMHAISGQAARDVLVFLQVFRC